MLLATYFLYFTKTVYRPTSDSVRKRGKREMMSKECANDIGLRKEGLLLSSKSQVVTPGVACCELRMPRQS